MRPFRPHDVGLEHLLGAGGAALLLVAASMWGERCVARKWDAHLLASVVLSTDAPAAPPAAAGEERVVSSPIPSDLLGTLEVPRIGLAAAVREGVDDATLDVSIGHVPGTAAPGQPGNAALAAHRDAEFRPLRNVRVGDEIRFVGPSGEALYRVAWTKVVPPGRVDVLGPIVSGSALTLVTCYPFGYVGHAPLRFVVRATRV